MQTNRFSGVFPILATAFTQEGAIDSESIRSLVRFQLNAGVHGLALFGMASETYALLETEKEQIIEIVKDEVNGRIPLIFGSGHTSMESAIALSKRAQQLGADALMVMAPSMIKPDGKRLYEYFAGIAAAVDIPIMLQDAPIASGVAMPTALIARLSKEFENVQYIKVEAPPTFIKMTEVLDATQGDLTIFGGMNGMYMYEEYGRGAVGTMPACEFPDACVKIYDAWCKGEHETARQIFTQLLPLIRIGTLPNFAMSVHKNILQMSGIITCAKVRNPNAPADEQLLNEIRGILKHIDIMAKQC